MLDYIDLNDNKGNNMEISTYIDLLIEELYYKGIINIDTQIIVAFI